MSLLTGLTPGQPMFGPRHEARETVRSAGVRGTQSGGAATARAGLFETCANPGCRSGWLHLWRSRSVPVFEGGWTCSPECTQAQVRRAVARELEGRGRAVEGHRHRIPLGLMLMEQGWITAGQLRAALEAQRSAGAGRVGQWLVRQRSVTESRVTQTLAQQWSCPVLALERNDPAALGSAMPRLFLDAFGALPLRVAGEHILYLGFEESIDAVLALAVERMTGLRVECGVAEGSRFSSSLARMLETTFPPVELVEASSEAAVCYALSKAVECSRPVQARLVRVHDCLWLRMYRSPQIGPLPETQSVTDVVCSLNWF